MRAVIKFSKSENVKYISHLDVLRMFQRALARSGLKVSYSGGYHPHMLLSFALAAPVGVVSCCEYAEVYFEHSMFCEEIAQRLALPGNCEVLEVFELGEKYPALMSVVSAADYRFDYKREDMPAISRCLDELMNQPEIIIMKKSKKGPKPVDIKPMIYRAELKEDCLDCSLASGGKLNLRPDALDELIFDKTGVRAEAITRTTLYIDENGKKIRPEKSEARI